MRSWAALALITSLVLLSSATAWSEPRIALRGEGYVGYNHLELGSLDEDAFEGGGGASASLVLDRLYLQGDLLGDRVQFDDVGPFDADLDADSVVAALRVGWRDAERGALGLVGAYEYLDLDASGGPGGSGSAETDIGRIGLETELFFGPVTLAGNGGVRFIDDEDSGYIDVGGSFYPTERARIHLGGGVADIEEDDPFGLIGAGAEILLLDPLSLFARWDATLVDDDVDFEQHSVVFGARLYWGAETPSLLAYDRSHFKRTCVAPLFATGRIC